ncbi:MAG: hypothetical protein L0228_20715 [Planctomycetes bacterium]|nr:hypothetical protein [Planctomycetota bacterium]
MPDICDAVLENGSAVLMARIVDGAGVCVRRSQVAAIGYSIYEVGRCDSERIAVVAGHDCVELSVDDLFLDSLEAGGLWSVDVAGYNFRHEIQASPNEAFPKAGARYEIRYLFVPRFGDPALIRFYVRIISR